MYRKKNSMSRKVDDVDKVLLLGATGMLGQSIGEQLKGEGYEVAGVARHNADYNIDLTIDDELKACVDSFKPDIVINSAADTDIDKCESKGVFRINGRLPGVLANLCRERDTYFIHISTDHYYTGDGNKKHKETDNVHIINEYARSKYCGELFALTYENALILRTNIVGFRGDRHRKTFVEWAIDEIKKDNMVNLYTDFYTSSMHTADFSKSLSRILANKRISGIYNLASSQVSNKRDFVCDLSVMLFGSEPKYNADSIKSHGGVMRAESLGLDTGKIENELGYRMPDLSQTLCSIKSEYERRTGS